MNSSAQNHELLEIRTYTIKAGMRGEFHRLVEEKAIPLLTKFGIRVLSYGASEIDQSTYHLIRGYTNVDDLNRSEEIFYNSKEWKEGPRESILALIVTYTTLALPAKAFQMSLESTSQDLKELSDLNALFIENFIKQDTTAHNEIIHKDFLCIENSGAIVDRNKYMKEWAYAYKEGNFLSFKYTDESIRLLGNVALVRSKTVYSRILEGKEVTGSSVYTDTYVKEEGRWWCIQAQITPVQ